jgi:hypothetical protein
MNARLQVDEAAIETMLVRRARRADPGDLAEVALDAISRTPARSARPWERLSASPRVVPGTARWLRLEIAAMLALALIGGLLAVGASRLLERPYPILTGSPELAPRVSRAASGDELWTITPDYTRIVGGLGERAAPEGNVPTVLWHYVGGAWQGPLSLAVLDGEMVSRLALGPDGTLWVSGETTVAVLRDGAWRVAWTASSGGGLRGLVVGPDGTAWVGQDRELVGLRREGAGYAARSVTCPHAMSEFAATTDGTIYVGSFAYSDGSGGLARSDGTTCALVDPVGDGQVHEVAGLSAGPVGSLLATVFDEEGRDGPLRVWVVMLRDGRWSTISGPTVQLGVSVGQAIDPDGHPWRIDRDGLERYEGDEWRVVAAPAHSLMMAPDGVLWYETDRGLERIRTDEVRD